MVVHFQKHGFLVVDEWNIETYVYQRFFYVDGKGMEPETSYIHHDRDSTVFRLPNLQYNLLDTGG